MFENTVVQYVALGLVVLCFTALLAVAVGKLLERSAAITWPESSVDMRPTRDGLWRAQEVKLDLTHDNPPIDGQIAHCDRVGNDGWHGWQAILVKQKETQ